jgi:outer membrane protein TolC
MFFLEPTRQRRHVRRAGGRAAFSLVIGALAFAAAANPARADDPAAGVSPAGAWTLERFLESARSDAPWGAAARAEGKAAEASASREWGALSPRVTATGGLTRSNDPALLFTQRLRQGRFATGDFALDALNEPGPRSAVEYGFVLEQPLWNGGAEITAPRAASHARREARASAEAAVADALLDAVGRYVAYIAARAEAAAESLATAAAEAAHDASVERHRRGQLADLDTLRTYAHSAETRERWLSTIRDRDVARRRLGDVAGVSLIDQDIAPPPAADPGTFLGAGADAGTSVADAEPQSLRAARARADRLDLEAARASMRLLPSLNGRVAVMYYEDPEAGGVERRWFAGLAVDWPLWDGTVRIQEKRAAGARAEAARARAEALRRELLTRREAARLDVELSAPRREAARAAREASEEALRLATARFRAGLLSLDALLDVDAEAARARKRHIEREAGVLLAGYTYLHATGRLK